MVADHTVALVGFAQNESSTIESFLRLASRRPPAYRVQDEVMDAQFLIVNADNLQALHLVRYAELPGRVLLLGSHDGGTGWPLQRKPVKLVGMLAALDALAGVSQTATPRKRASPSPVFAATELFMASRVEGLGAGMRRPGSSRPVAARAASAAPRVPARSPQRPAPETAFLSTLPMQSVEPPVAAAATAPGPPAPVAPRQAKPLVPTASRRPGVLRLTDFGSFDELPLPPMAPQSPSRFAASRSGRLSRPTRAQTGGGKAALPEVARGNVLLVAESLVEGRILHQRLRRYGFSIDWSREGAQSLMMLKAHAYRLVVIDRLSGEPDAWQVCRSAKKCRLPNGQSPVVVMFAPTAGSMDRMKAGLAGSDAYLSRSLREAELYEVLARHQLVSLDGFEKTNVGF